MLSEEIKKRTGCLLRFHPHGRLPEILFCCNRRRRIHFDVNVEFPTRDFCLRVNPYVVGDRYIKYRIFMPGSRAACINLIYLLIRISYHLPITTSHPFIAINLENLSVRCYEWML